ncbi:MAG: ABC transporter ATP-binding protein [Pseudomonadota bacterium]
MSLEFVNVQHSYDDEITLKNITLTANPGDITCLLGPSGCGKTTLLRLAAGILEIQKGEIRLDGEILAKPGASPPPEARPVGLIFQEGALFPHMSVARNVSFGIEAHEDKAAIVSDLLQRVGMAEFGARYPHTLSGGQQQRVALARALAPAPRVLLFDEPFASVDVVRRRALREDTRRALKSRDAIAIIVTHDPEESMEIADHIAVMEDGEIIQHGAPEALYDAPASASVGALISESQIIAGRRNGDMIETAFGTWPAALFRSPLPETAKLDLLMRPDAVQLAPGETASRIIDSRRTGRAQRITVEAPGGTRLIVETSNNEGFEAGQSVQVQPRSQAIIAFPADSA